MAKIEILLPAMGEGIIEATITKWLVNIGDEIEEDQSIVEVATDKVDSEIPAPEAGIIEKLLFNEDDIPKVGDTIAILSTNNTDQVDEVENEPKPNIETIVENKSTIDSASNKTQNENLSEQISSKTPKGKFLSPLVKSIAEKENISLDEIDNIKPNNKRVASAILSY